MSAGWCHGVDSSQRVRVAQRLCQALQHGSPALAARNDGIAPVASGFDERRFGQPSHRHGAAFAQRHQARVAKTAYQHSIRLRLVL
ncbi:hypothetical protein D3C72_2228230 [compost metagenome]